jgi:hypothetical protein
MRENNIPLATSHLQLPCILDTSPVGMLIFNDREEIITTIPPATHIFSLTPQNVPPQKWGNFIHCANRLRPSNGRVPSSR